MSITPAPHDAAPELLLDIHRTAQLLGGANQRTIRRWVALGLPRRQDGLFAFPTAALWWLIHVRHKKDERCRVEVEEDILLLLRGAMKVLLVTTPDEAQGVLRQICGGELSTKTLAAITANGHRACEAKVINLREWTTRLALREKGTP